MTNRLFSFIIIFEDKTMDITITNTISPEEYLGLRQAVGWSVFPREQAESGLQNSHVICFRDKEKAVALGRVIWDLLKNN